MTNCEQIQVLHNLKKIWINDKFYKERKIYAPIRRVKYDN